MQKFLVSLSWRDTVGWNLLTKVFDAPNATRATETAMQYVWATEPYCFGLRVLSVHLGAKQDAK